MMGLISRTAIAEEVGQLKSIIKECTNTDYYKGYVCALSGVEGMIAQQPTIDAVPVVHGEWVADDSGIYFCSECDSEAYWDTDYGQQVFDWCPYCGSRMKE